MTQTPIHIKLEYEEALNSKRNLLNSQRGLLRSLRFMNQYYASRLYELKIKTKLHKKLKETLTELNKTEKVLPRADIPKILKKEDKEEYQFEKKVQQKKEKYDKDIESQLADIQRRLRMLQ
ncbi:MAG: hypothetical protein WC584_01450 [Candidatus Pacearchaeota archaeon]